jgi:hypothetical protein
VIVLIALGYNLFFVYVQPDKYGIKVARVGMKDLFTRERRPQIQR